MIEDEVATEVELRSAPSQSRARVIRNFTSVFSGKVRSSWKVLCRELSLLIFLLQTNNTRHSRSLQLAARTSLGSSSVHRLLLEKFGRTNIQPDMRSPVGVSATVQVGHRDLTEHEDPEEDDGDALVRYVEAVPGQNFEVRAHLHHNFLYRHDDINIVVWIDGKWTASQVLTRNSTDAHFRGARRTVRGQSYLQRFCFAELKTSRFTQN